MANNEYHDQVSPFSIVTLNIFGKFWGHYILAAVSLSVGHHGSDFCLMFNVLQLEEKCCKTIYRLHNRFSQSLVGAFSVIVENHRLSFTA